MSHPLSRTPEPSETRGPIVWLGPPFFAPYLEKLGWRVIRATHDLDRPRSWDDVLALTGDVTPAALVTADSSIPPPITGMENFPCLTVFYAVDSHIHSWYPLYGQGFDLCLVSLRDHLPLFAKGRLNSGTVRWNPAYALDEHRPPDAPPPPAGLWPAGAPVPWRIRRLPVGGRPMVRRIPAGGSPAQSP